MAETVRAKKTSDGHRFFQADQVRSQLYAKYPAGDADNSMVTGLRKRSETAFSEMVQRYQQILFKVAFRITRNHEDAEEAVQDAFVKVFQRIESFRGDSLFKTWITRIAMNEALLKIRKTPRHHFSIDQKENGSVSAVREIAAVGCTPEESCSLREIESMAFGSLPRISRASWPVVKLCLQMELSQADAAKRLRLNLSTVKSRLSRGRKELRKTLAQDYSRKRYPFSGTSSEDQPGLFQLFVRNR